MIRIKIRITSPRFIILILILILISSHKLPAVMSTL
jgi:hypothetical protein